jgi:cystathionine beta-lyase
VSFDFDRVISREGTSSVKYDARQTTFGRADVMPLWVADMDFASPECVTEALVQRAQHPVYGYTLAPESLFDALIDWLKTRHGWEIQREWIILCPGVVPSLYAAVQAFAQPGEGVIIQPPVYFPFMSSVMDTGRQLIINPLKLENGRYTFDLAHLEQSAAQGAQLLLLCSPHNPVGRVWSRQELNDLLEIARRYDLVILSDEIHADLLYPGTAHIPLAAMESNVITAVAPSKTFNIPGLGLSALVVPNPAHRAALNKVFGQMHVSSTNPFGMAAFEAAYRGGASWLDALMAYLAETRDAVRNDLAAELPQIKLIEPEGTYLLWLDCREMGLSDQELRQFLVKQAGIGLSPGTLFGEGGSGFMRMNIGAPRALILQAMKNIAEAMRRMQHG